MYQQQPKSNWYFCQLFKRYLFSVSIFGYCLLL